MAIRWGDASIPDSKRYTPVLNARVTSPAGTSAQPVVFCPAHIGEKLSRPTNSACVRSGANAEAASGGRRDSSDRALGRDDSGFRAQGVRVLRRCMRN